MFRFNQHHSLTQTHSEQCTTHTPHTHTPHTYTPTHTQTHTCTHPHPHTNTDPIEYPATPPNQPQQCILTDYFNNYNFSKLK